MPNLSGEVKLLSELEERTITDTEFGNLYLLIGLLDLYKIKGKTLFELMRKAAGYPKIERGRVSVPITAASTPSALKVTFSKAFESTPNVVACADSSVPGTSVLEVSVSNVTITGFTIYVTRANTSNTPVQWVAIGE